MAIAVLIATLLFIASSFIVPFGGFDPNAFPVPQEDPPVQPAGYAFSIWAVIYLWLAVSAMYGVLRRREDAAWQAVRPPLLVSLGVGMFWLPVASRSPEWATVLIWIMLVAALIAALRVPRQDIAWLALPVGLYAGWLTAASAVSVGLLGAGYGVAMGQVGWAVVSICLALAIAIAILRRTAGMWTYAAAVVWALVGVVVQNSGGAAIVLSLAAVGVVIVAAAAVLIAREA